MIKETRIIMGMPVAVEIAGARAGRSDAEKIFSYFDAVDRRFSTYKPESEISRINRGEIAELDWSPEMKEVFRLAEETKRATDGYFDIKTPNGGFDPSGLVKGWAISRAAEILSGSGFENFFVDAGGDIEARGSNPRGKPWAVGIRNPFNQREIVKIIPLRGGGVATSGTYIRGQHIWNPKAAGEPIEDIVSLTVVGPSAYEADRFATAAFAMGRRGIGFIERRPGLEGYMIDARGAATMTSGFEKHLHESHR